jgi:RNA polymerase sigma-70 factor (ECF subfamily)
LPPVRVAPSRTGTLGTDDQNVEGLLTADVLRVLQRFALKLTGDGHAAEDLVQEACARAWQRRGQLRSGGAVRGWLLSITANLWRDRLRCKALPMGMSATEELAASRPAAAEQLVTDENVRRALAAIATLPPAQRDALYLAAVEGLRRDEIAEILGTTTGAVKVNLSIARRKMRERLKDILEDL